MMTRSSTKRKTRRAVPATQQPPRRNVPQVAPWPTPPNQFHVGSVLRQRWLLIVVTFACLLPFVNEAFHVDDPLFLWAAKQIVQHPLDPYGFSVVWYHTAMPMAEVTKNPPLASYLLALVGSWAGWSERVLHFAFLFPSVAVILGVHQLARDMTRSPLLAAAATLATPAFLISATSIMCDVPMLAIWLFAIILWRKGIRDDKIGCLVVSGVFIGLCSLTKYFGICLIPLLLLWTIWSKRRIGSWLFCLLIPVAILAAYQAWTASLYGNGLLSGLAGYVRDARIQNSLSPVGSFLVAMSFAGGCALPALLFVPWLWSRRWTLPAVGLATLGAAAIVFSWVRVEAAFPEDHRGLLASQLALFILAGLSILSLAFTDFWRRRDADSVLLLAWVAGTVIFAAFLNWTVNGRSMLPMIPAVALLIARRLEFREKPRAAAVMVAPVALCFVVSLWATAGDAAFANSARTAAAQVHERGARELKRILFAGHWGFQYYMELAGGVAVSPEVQPTLLDLLVVPRNNSNADVNVAPLTPAGSLSIPIRSYVSTMQVGAGFYSSLWGPMPYAFAPVPDEQYDFYRFDGLGKEMQ